MTKPNSFRKTRKTGMLLFVYLIKDLVFPKDTDIFADAEEDMPFLVEDGREYLRSAGQEKGVIDAMAFCLGLQPEGGEFVLHFSVIAFSVSS